MQNLTVITKLGEGACSKVEMVHLDGKPYSLKTALVKKHDLSNYLSEIQILQDLKDEGLAIPIYVDSLISQPSNLLVGVSKVEILTHYIEGEPIDSYVGSNIVSSRILLNIIRQLVNIICRLHTLGIVHQDIKPENILFNKNSETVTLIDFGFSKYVNPNSDKVVIFDSRILKGTPLFCSPQKIARQTARKNRSNLACKFATQLNPFLDDIWALGFTTYMIIKRVEPFGHGISDVNYFAREIYTQPTPLTNTIFDEFIGMCLTKDADCRPNIYDLYEYLNNLRI